MTGATFPVRAKFYEILQHFSLMSFPKLSSICFWICIFSGVTGVVSSTFIYIATRNDPNFFPSFTQILNWKLSRKPFIIFESVSCITLFFVSFSSLKHYSRSLRSGSRAARKKLRFLYPCLAATSLILPISHAFLIYLHPLISPTFHEMAFYGFYLSFIIFHIVNDLLYAVSTDSMMTAAWGTDLICILIAIITFLLKTISGITGISFGFSFKNFLTFCLICSCFLKLIFTGITVIGTEFVSNTANLFQRKKQTIFKENFYQA